MKPKPARQVLAVYLLACWSVVCALYLLSLLLGGQ